MNWTFVSLLLSPPSFIYWDLILDVIVLGGGGLQSWLGHEDGALMNGISAFIKETPESILDSSTMWGYSEKTPSMN